MGGIGNCVGLLLKECLQGKVAGTEKVCDLLFDRRDHKLGLLLPFLYEQTSQELRMLSSVTLNCQATKIVMNSVFQLSEL